MQPARGPVGGLVLVRIVVAGWTNSPHVVRWAATLVELGHDVVLVGHRTPAWAPLAPPVGLAGYEEFRLGAVPLWRSLRLGRELRRVVDDVRPALVHAHWLPEYGWLAAGAGIHPLVSSAWGSDVLGAGWLGRRRSARAMAGSDLVLADSAALAEAARALSPHGAPVEVFHPGVDLERFSPGDRGVARRALGWPAEAPIVLSVRALGPVYNQDFIVRAVGRARKAFPGVRLVLRHSGGALPQPLARALDEAGLADAVLLIGPVDAATLPSLYRAADVVVSVPSSDSSPASAWEALACARPLVVSDLPWARAELRHRENACLVELQECALTEVVTCLLGDRTLAAQIAAGGRTLAETRMDSRVKAQELDQWYRRLVGA